MAQKDVATLSLLVLALTSLPLFEVARAAAGSTCFFPNGAIHDKGSSCDPDADVSHCCEGTHTCLSNGLCWDLEFNHVIRVSCTDSTWGPSCPQYCVTNDPDQTGSFGDVRQCSDDNVNWVCGMDTADGCSNSFTLPWGYVDDKRNSTVNNIIADGGCASNAAATITSTVLATVTVNSLATVTNSGSASTVSSSSATAAGAGVASPSCTSDSTSSLAAGLGAGLGAGVPLLLALAAALFYLQKARKENRKWEKQFGHYRSTGTEMPDFNDSRPVNGYQKTKHGHSGGNSPSYQQPPAQPAQLVYEAPGH